MYKADDTSAAALYAPLRRVASANAKYWAERCADAPEVVHVVRGDVDAIAREMNVPNVEHLAAAARFWKSKGASGDKPGGG